MGLVNRRSDTVPAPEAAPPPSASVHTLSGTLLRQLHTALGNPPVCLRLWTGEQVMAPGMAAVATFEIADRAALLRLIADPEMQFGEMFTEDRIRLVDGSLVSALEQVFLREATPAAGTGLLPRVTDALRRSRANTLEGSRRNIHEHYDLGNEFYRLWLDPTLSYTCAYFPDANATLVDAQIAKLDHVCRKLQLQPDEQIIEAGCGWGSFALHAASRYGARVRAFNISHEQILCARERAQRAGLTGRVEFIEDDYRNASGNCDAFVSIGMLEHVGPENYAELGRVITRTLQNQGRGLIHSIGRNSPLPVNRWIERRIFPGSYVPSLQEMMQIFEPNGLSVLDVENLRLHYARTLRFWAEACARERAAICRMFDERFYRMWTLYLASSQAAFLSGEMQLFQALFAPARSNRIPWTREHLYQPDTRLSSWTAATS